MTTQLQNKVWSILPKEFKEEVKKLYIDALVASNSPHEPDDRKWGNYRVTLLGKLFSHHNLTSDAVEEEMLTCEKYKVEEALNYCDELDSISGSHNMINWGKQMIEYLFGSKGLLDTEPILQPFSQVKKTATSTIPVTESDKLSKLNDALLKLEEASKQVREELTKLNEK